MITRKKVYDPKPPGITYKEALLRPIKTTLVIAEPHAAAGNVCMVCRTYSPVDQSCRDVIINLFGAGEVLTSFDGRFIEVAEFWIEEAK